MYQVHFSLLIKLDTSFHSRFTTLYFHHPEGFTLTMSSRAFVVICVLNHCHSGQGRQNSNVVLTCISQMGSEVEHFFMLIAHL